MRETGRQEVDGRISRVRRLLLQRQEAFAHRAIRQCFQALTRSSQIRDDKLGCPAVVLEEGDFVVQLHFGGGDNNRQGKVGDSALPLTYAGTCVLLAPADNVLRKLNASGANEF